MKNFEITAIEDGKKYWVSRSVAVLAEVIVNDEPVYDEYDSHMSIYSSDGSGVNSEVIHNKILKRYNKNYILVNKRGNGCPNYRGCWNIVCGYIDYDETIKECATREIMEECGIFIEPDKWRISNKIDDIVKDGDKKQNITIPCSITLTMEEYLKCKEEGDKKRESYSGEVDEVDDIELMELTKKNIENREWAFNHKKLITDMCVAYSSDITYIL